MDFGACRVALCIVFATCCAAALAQDMKEPTLGDELLAEDFLGTTLSVGLRGAAGYKDNVLLTETGKIQSSFIRADFDAFLWRPPEFLTDVYWALTGSETLYLDAPSDAREERVWMTQAEWRYSIGTYFKAGLSVQGYHQDQVIDLSTSEIGTFRARLKVSGITAGPNLRWEIRDPWWFEVSAAWKIETYKGAPEDFDEPGFTIRIGRKLGASHDLSVAWTGRKRDYDERNAFTIGGRPLPGTTLETEWSGGELRLVSKWNKSGSLSSTMKLAADRLRDSAFGYFDYDHWQAEAEARWKNEAWDVRAKATHGVHDYLIQVSGTGFDPAPREIEQTSLSLSAERRLSERWMLFAEVSSERNETNDPGGDYRVNTGFAGLSLEF